MLERLSISFGIPWIPMLLVFGDSVFLFINHWGLSVFTGWITNVRIYIYSGLFHWAVLVIIILSLLLQIITIIITY